MSRRGRSLSGLAAIVLALLVAPGPAPAAEICETFNGIDISDPAGDASPGSPDYVDVLGLHVRQVGQYVQLEWDSAGNPNSADDQYFFIFFDGDRNPATGQGWNAIGAEARIVVDPYWSGDLAKLQYFDAGENLVFEETNIPVSFSDAGFRLLVELERLPSTHFDLYFESSGQPTWWDSGSVHEIELLPAAGAIGLRLDSNQVVLEEGPRLFHLPNPGDTLQLSAVAVRDGSETVLPASEVSFLVYHSRPDFVPDPSSVISVNEDGLAAYHSEGFVFVSGRLDECALTSEGVILATGDPYGDPRRHRVLAVFPTDHAPEGSTVTFGDMMSGHPEMIEVLNLAYGMSCDLYGGYRPLHGDWQILSPIVAPGLCGGPGNPMEISPCCYMNCLDASPQYELIVHEMGHNFQKLGGMAQLLYGNDGDICGSGFCECSASLPVIYFEHEMVANGPAYGIHPGSFPYEYFREFRDYYCPTSQGILQDFEQQVTAGTLSGVFDPDVEDGVAVHCSFFEQFTCGYVEGANPYGWEAVRRFLEILGDRTLPGYVAEKAETYFGAVYSLAVGRDMRTKLRFWGFEIDDAYFEEIMPWLELRLEQAEHRILHETFETGELGAWALGGGDDVRVRGGLGAYGGLFGAEIRLAPCATDKELVLGDLTVSGVQRFEACHSITAGDGFVVAAGGEAALMAGDSIGLQDNLRVEAGGQLTATILPSLSPFAFLEDDSPSSEVGYHAEFFVNLDELSIGGGDEIDHFVAYGPGGLPIVKVVLSSGPQATMSASNDGGSWHSTSGIGLAAGWNKVAIGWEAAGSASASLTVNDGWPAEITGLDTGSLRVESIRWGAVGGTIDGTEGTIRLDEFASWR